MPATDIVVLFLTDVEGSSRLWQAHPDDMGEVIDQLDDLVQSVVNEHGGALLKSRGEGDSHFVCFPLASRAVRAAVELQRRLLVTRWSSGIELKLRIALHVGEVQRRELDYSGIAVNRAARVRSAAHGGQIMTTRIVADLVGNELGDELRLISLGSHRLRDIPGWTELFQVCGPSLPREFPSPVTLDTGLPPMAAIVFVDVAKVIPAARRMTGQDEHALWSVFVELFSLAFARAGGMLYQHMGDGCLGFFADPAHALAFVRDVRTSVRALDFELKAVMHLGRVSLFSGIPYGRDIAVAALLLPQAVPGKIMLSPTAAAVIEPAPDTELAQTP